ncbi:hypothetical protein HYV12_03990 [Candidatus Dojkabacteria bacterium]|nr:hypothetical protein [Candidatus Dojkabacteria bacterium]
MNTPEISNRVLNTDELPKTSIKAAWKENLQVTVTVGDEPIVLHFDHSSGVTIVEGDGETQPTTIKIEDTSYTHSRLELTLA